MAQHEATSTNIGQVIDSAAPRFSDWAGFIAMCFYALLCIDLFAIAVGWHSWAATLVAIAGASIGGAIPSVFVSTGLVAVLAIFWSISQIGNSASRWTHTLKADLRATMPSSEWMQGGHLRPIIGWVVMLPLMAVVSIALLSAADVFGVLNSVTFHVLAAVATILSAWVGAAMAVGMSRDRYAVRGLLVAILSYIIVVFPFGRSLIEAVHEFHAGDASSSGVLASSWIAAALFYFVLGSRALLAIEMERDYDQIKLTIGSDTTEPPILVINRPDRLFVRPVYLYVDTGAGQTIAFARSEGKSDFFYVPLSQLSDRPFRIDKEEIRIFNLSRIASLVSGKVTTTGPIEVNGSIALDLRESAFTDNPSAERWFTRLEVQGIQEIFNTEVLKSLFSVYLTDAVKGVATDVMNSIRPIEEFLMQFQAKISSAGMKGDIQARKGAGLLSQNSAGAMGEGSETSKALEEALKDASTHMETIRNAELRVDGLADEVVAGWKKKMLSDFDNRCGSKSGGLRGEVKDFLDALGPRIQVDACTSPKLLSDLKSNMEKVTNLAAEKLKEVTARLDKATQEQTTTVVGVLKDARPDQMGEIIRTLSGPQSIDSAHQLTNQASEGLGQDEEVGQAAGMPSGRSAGRSSRDIEAEFTEMDPPGQM